MIVSLDPFARRVVVSMTLIAVFAFIMVFVTMCMTRQTDARQQVQITRATGKALDKVASQTPAIRQEQKEREHEAERIEGADAPLPDGFGRELERVRMRERAHR